MISWTLLLTTVTPLDWSEGGGGEVEELWQWDAVVVAIEWYDHSVFPEMEGLDKFKQQGLAKHVKWWCGPDGYSYEEKVSYWFSTFQTIFLR